jgi:hypothetical protein
MLNQKKKLGRPKIYLTEEQRLAIKKQQNDRYYAKIKQSRDQTKNNDKLKCSSCGINDADDNDDLCLMCISRFVHEIKFLKGIIKILKKKFEKPCIQCNKNNVSIRYNPYCDDCKGKLILPDRTKQYKKIYEDRLSKINEMYININQFCCHCLKQKCHELTAPYCPKCWEDIEYGETW